MAKRKKRAWNNTNPLFRYLAKKKGKKSVKTTTKVQTMAKKRRFGKRSKSRSSSSSNMSLMNIAGAGAIHGFARPLAGNMLPSLFSFGPIDSDNVILGAAGYYAMKKGSGMIKVLGMLTLANEISYVTQKLTSGASNDSSVSSTDPYSY